MVRGADGHLYLGLAKETLAELVVHFIAHPDTTEQHAALLRSATTAEEWRIADEMVRFGRTMVTADA